MNNEFMSQLGFEFTFTTKNNFTLQYQRYSEDGWRNININNYEDYNSYKCRCFNDKYSIGISKNKDHYMSNGIMLDNMFYLFELIENN